MHIISFFSWGRTNKTQKCLAVKESCHIPLLFVVFINDMPAVVNHIIKLFADDSKLIGVIKNNSDLELVQKDLDALVCWANEWRMLFQPD